MRIKTELDREKQDKFVEGVQHLAELNMEIFKEKNAKYGNSFYDNLKDYGFLTLLIRLVEKTNRLEELIYRYEELKETDDDESILDTLMDISNYCLMGAEFYNQMVKHE